MIFRTVEDYKSAKRGSLAYIGVYVLVLALVLLASSFCSWSFASSYYFCNIEGLSMQPTINPDTTVQEQTQDGVLIKVTKNVKFNDIISIHAPTADKPNRSIIKRVIALDGDAVTIILDDDGYYHTYVCRAGSDQVERIDESYVAQDDLEQWLTETKHRDRTPKADTTSYRTTFEYEGLIYKNYLQKYVNTINAEGQAKVVVKQINGKDALFYQCDSDEIFFMGDHRSVSSDARDVAVGITTVKHESVIGKAVYLIHDVVEKEKTGKLWWSKIGALFDYFWHETANFFAW